MKVDLYDIDNMIHFVRTGGLDVYRDFYITPMYSDGNKTCEFESETFRCISNMDPSTYIKHYVSGINGDMMYYQAHIADMVSENRKDIADQVMDYIDYFVNNPNIINHIKRYFDDYNIELIRFQIYR